MGYLVYGTYSYHQNTEKHFARREAQLTSQYPVSVIIPARNAELTVRRAIQSALRAGANEVIVIDDASRDQTFHRALELCAGGGSTTLTTSRVRILQSGKIRVGVCVARNMGIELAREKLILPLDADDTLMDDSLEYLVQNYRPGSLVYGGWQINGVDYEAPPQGMLNRKNVAYATWLFEKSAWRAVEGYDPRFEIGGEDWAFMIALIHAGIAPVRLEGAIYNRTVNIGSRTGGAQANHYFIKEHLKQIFPAFFSIDLRNDTEGLNHAESTTG